MKNFRAEDLISTYTQCRVAREEIRCFFELIFSNVDRGNILKQGKSEFTIDGVTWTIDLNFLNMVTCRLSTKKDRHYFYHYSVSVRDGRHECAWYSVINKPEYVFAVRNSLNRVLEEFLTLSPGSLERLQEHVKR